MVPLDRALVSSYRLSIVTMSLTAAVWQIFWGGIGRLTCIGSYVNKQVTAFIFWAQATTCSKHHTRTVMDAGCECHHEYGRLTLVTAGLLFCMIQLVVIIINFCIILPHLEHGKGQTVTGLIVVTERLFHWKNISSWWFSFILSGTT